MKYRLMLAVSKTAALVLLLVSHTAFAWDSGLEIDTPERMDVIIEELGEDARSAGLSEDVIRAKVELQLRRNGIIPNAEPEYKDGYLYVRVTISGVAFSSEVSFKRDVTYVVKGKTYKTIATVWEKSGTGIFDRDSAHLLGLLADYMDMFINAYLKVNRKQ
jgi:hypothetical protein